MARKAKPSVSPKVTKTVKLKTTLPKRKTPPKSNQGRKWFDTKSDKELLIILTKLEKAFKTGTTNERACLYAGISLKSFYDYCDKHPEFREQVGLWKENILLVAETKLFESVFAGNREDVRYVLERRDKSRYSPQVNAIIDNGNGTLTEERQAEIAKAMGNWFGKKNDSVISSEDLG